MSKNFSIGLLLPSSTILPVGKDFEQGVKRGLKTLTTNGDYAIEFIPEFIAEGSKEKTETAINKLINYHNVDAITGIISNRTLLVLAEKLSKTKIPVIINNIGEHILDARILQPNIYINSTHVWQQIWSLGYWGVQNKGLKGMFMSGIYDSGYSFSLMLQMGMQAADKNATMPFAVAPISTPGSLADVKSTFQYIDQFKPDFIFATFCGEEASIFLKEYVERGYHKTIPLLGLPFLLQPFDSAGQEVTIYTTVTSNTDIDESQLNDLTAMADNPFPYLGYETGLLLQEAINNTENLKDLKQTIAETTVHSQRGKINILSQESGDGAKVFLIKNTFDGKNIKREIVQELNTLYANNQSLIEALDAPSSGWYNPYPGV